MSTTRKEVRRLYIIPKYTRIRNPRAVRRFLQEHNKYGGHAPRQFLYLNPIYLLIRDNCPNPETLVICRPSPTVSLVSTSGLAWYEKLADDYGFTDKLIWQIALSINVVQFYHSIPRLFSRSEWEVEHDHDLVRYAKETREKRKQYLAQLHSRSWKSNHPDPLHWSHCPLMTAINLAFTSAVCDISPYDIIVQPNPFTIVKDTVNKKIIGTYTCDFKFKQ